LFNDLERVKVYDVQKIEGWSNQEIAGLAEKELDETGSVLVIVNTKKSAIKIFQQLQPIKNKAQIFHLSTNMCPAHRMKILNDIQNSLDNKKPIICVSTQLIEAGVDIDFGTVIRFLAGLDSIAQAAGRCNRNGIRPNLGRVYIVNPNEENLVSLKDIKIGRDIAERVLDEFRDNPKQFDNDIIGPKTIEMYYKYYFYERSNEMDYNVEKKSEINRDDNLFELLSTNKLSVDEFKRVNQSAPNLILRQSFKSASKLFHAIDLSARGVIVPYEEGNGIITGLCAADSLKKQYTLLKQAQRYSVNLYPNIFDKFLEQKTLNETQKGSGIFYLDKQYYSEHFGVSESIINEMEFLNP